MISTYWIVPKAPLLFRDGRPFGSAERAETLPFPIPSTLAGAFRTAYGDSRELDFASQKDQVMKLRLAGPLLARRTLSNGALEPLFPKPADAVYFGENEAAQAVRLAPGMALSGGEGTDLDELSDRLRPVFLQRDLQEKPSRGPAFWNLSTYINWLKDDRSDAISMQRIGEPALPLDIRTHVAMERATLTSRDGQLFQTSGLDFGPRPLDPVKQLGWEDSEYGLLARVAMEDGDRLPDDFRTLGGERRPARIERCDGGSDPWPVCPEPPDKAQGLRLILVTPGLFDQGWRPGWLDDKLEGTPPGYEGLKLRLSAAALDRWQPVSGWDMQPEPGKAHVHHTGGMARAVRRMTPAGAVYWFEVLETGGTDFQSWFRRLWLSSMCDLEQDNRDGFGLAVPAVWTNPA